MASYRQCKDKQSMFVSYDCKHSNICADLSVKYHQFALYLVDQECLRHGMLFKLLRIVQKFKRTEEQEFFSLGAFGIGIAITHNIIGILVIRMWLTNTFSCIAVAIANLLIFAQ
ncbi:unnamed protein product [Parnassius apollo]|uniref:(apollo) hypothetical protein n=1 Tax=Parnassius apollo TaxID=110799 RepID=A0A8S3X4U5_PARAO|nr:unnamed protein product [Parnassius apollo]